MGAAAVNILVIEDEPKVGRALKTTKCTKLFLSVSWSGMNVILLIH